MPFSIKLPDKQSKLSMPERSTASSTFCGLKPDTLSPENYTSGVKFSLLAGSISVFEDLHFTVDEASTVTYLHLSNELNVRGTMGHP